MKRSAVIVLLVFNYHCTPSKTDLLISSFEPFGKRDINISQKLAEDLSEPDALTHITLPVTFEGSWDKLSNILTSAKPSVVILLGEHKHSTIRVDISAQNYYRDAYNEGKIDLNGPDFLPSPIAEDLPSIPGLNFNEDAGRYICNYVYYKALQNHANAVFIHVPELTDTEYRSKKQSLLSILHQVIQHTSKVR